MILRGKRVPLRPSAPLCASAVIELFWQGVPRRTTVRGRARAPGRPPGRFRPRPGGALALWNAVFSAWFP